eukprot:CAMPEP_0179435826 /NCGR_PEP_ID=MMETSP0799-20121207/19871_1 /TAXON_ID=46947 /ORGANISM="Geminigera cryophila, Strain CCMP2564" /LENGTH=56 /DNA_ID=CAMNT_0021215455 /DNA_START=60 /DNA_END=227 /DNA_ORIENTATION=+
MNVCLHILHWYVMSLSLVLSVELPPLRFLASAALRSRATADFWALPPPMVTCFMEG